MSETECTKKCWKCNQVKPLSDYSRNSTRSDGHQSACKQCFTEIVNAWRKTPRGHALSKKARTRYRQTTNGKEHEKQYQITQTAIGRFKESRSKYRKSEKGKARRKEAIQRYGVKMKAKRAVYYAVQKGLIPKATTMLCRLCPNPASHYHHHIDHSKDHYLDVMPVCPKCHSWLDRKTHPGFA